MKIYIATALARIEDYRQLAAACMERGVEITYNWSVHGPVWKDGESRLNEVALMEMNGVLDADIVIALLPGGSGTHVEIGMAIAACKPIVLHMDPNTFPQGCYAQENTCAFYHLKNGRIFHCFEPEPHDILDYVFVVAALKNISLARVDVLPSPG